MMSTIITRPGYSVTITGDDHTAMTARVRGATGQYLTVGYPDTTDELERIRTNRRSIEQDAAEALGLPFVTVETWED